MNSIAVIFSPGSSSPWVYSCKYLLLLSPHKHHFISFINFYSVKREVKTEELFIVSQLWSHISVISRVTRSNTNYRDLYVHTLSGAAVNAAFECVCVCVLSLFVISFLMGIQYRARGIFQLPWYLEGFFHEHSCLGWGRCGSIMMEYLPSQPCFFTLALLDRGLRFLWVRGNPTFQVH
jgi:hypothetical protein